MADTEPGLRLHYVDTGAGRHTIVLLHGFPQTWWEWRHVIPALVDADYRVIAPDYRGAGDSWRPATGYDKRTMASDIHRLVRDHLRISAPVVMVGHDIGLMVAYAYAQAHRGDVTHLVVMDAPLPGTAIFDRLRSDRRLWHFAFHGVRDLPEMLVAGRERHYLQAFFNARISNTEAIAREDLDTYVSAYSSPGAMRAGFETYRAFDKDAEDNLDALSRNGKLAVPVLAVYAAVSNSGPLVEEMMRDVSENVTPLRVPRSAHWIPEENPLAFVEGLLKFLGDGQEGSSQRSPLEDSGEPNMSQTALLADQIRRAFEGEAWHGDSVLEILKGIKAAQAAARPIKNAHSIWEIVGHIAAWDEAVLTRTSGQAATVSDKDNFPVVTDASEAAWRKAVEHLTEVHGDLVKAVSNFPDSRLQEQVPGKLDEPYYNYYYMFSGIVQHELYHAGQIAILKKAF